VKKPVKIVALSCILCSVAVGNACHADGCKEIDTEQTIADLVKQNEGSKVLKVEESTDDKGCVVLEVKILVDGTVKVITIPNETGA